ncbi:MAG: ABC transporter permease [Vicinamibacterales bacterium]
MRLVGRLAWRSLWRNPRRTVITLSAVAFAVTILIVMRATQRGGYGAMIESAIGVYTGDLQVQHVGYHAKPRIEATVPDADALAVRMAAMPGVAAVATRAQAEALVSSPSRTFGAAVVGVRPDREPEVSTIPGTVRAGRYLAPGDAETAVIGDALARNLSLKVGDELTVLGQGADGSLATLVCTVVGVFSSGSADLDRQVVEVPLAALQRAFALDGAAHSLVIRTRSLEDVPVVTGAIRTLLAGRPALTVLPWNDLLDGLEQGIAIDAAVGWFLYAMLVLVVVFSILNTFITSVLERTREFGVLLALGVRPRFLGTVVATEFVFVIGAGLAVGMALGLALTGYAAAHGIAFASNEALLAQWHLPARIYPEISLATIATGPLIVLAAASLAALFPIVHVRRLRPVDAMKAV